MEEHAGADGRWLPDVQELRRLHALADGRRPDGWMAWFDPSVGYASVPVVGPGDVVPATGVTRARFQELARLAWPDGGDAWARDVERPGGHPALALRCAAELRRLRVLEHDLDGLSPVDDLDTFDPDRDRTALANLLADAYDGTPDGWDAERITAELARDGFDATDILVARSVTRAGELDGAHWTMRRDERTGEVHNLSVHPRARGHGLAHRLLDAGLARLAAQGCRRVILWVDEANEPAMRLYRAAGFTTAWVDALLRVPPA